MKHQDGKDVKFNLEQIQNTLDNVASHYKEYKRPVTVDSGTFSDDGVITFLAANIVEAEVMRKKICVEIPFGLGRHCLPLPFFFNEREEEVKVRVSLDISTRWGIPEGVKVTVNSIDGQMLVNKTFGIFR